MNKILRLSLLFFIIFFFIQCTKNSSNPDGIPLVPDGGGQVGFASEGAVNIINPNSNSGAGGVIPAETISTINVSRIGTITNPNNLVVEVNLEFTEQENITMILVAPGGFEYKFVDRAGQPNNIYKGTNTLRFSSAFTNRLPNTGVTFAAGDYRESYGSVFNPLPAIFSGIQGKGTLGTWQLKIIDNNVGGVGKLISWKIYF